MALGSRLKFSQLVYLDKLLSLLHAPVCHCRKLEGSDSCQEIALASKPSTKPTKPDAKQESLARERWN